MDKPAPNSPRADCRRTNQSDPICIGASEDEEDGNDDHMLVPISTGIDDSLREPKTVADVLAYAKSIYKSDESCSMQEQRLRRMEAILEPMSMFSKSVRMDTATLSKSQIYGPGRSMYTNIT